MLKSATVLNCIVPGGKDAGMESYYITHFLIKNNEFKLDKTIVDGLEDRINAMQIMRSNRHGEAYECCCWLVAIASEVRSMTETVTNLQSPSINSSKQSSMNKHGKSRIT
jgi:hypothetical protein